MPHPASPTEFPPELTARYRPERPLGSGGFGAVWLARDLGLDRLVAIKLLHAGNRDQEVRARFQREARLASSIDHPNVLPAYDFGVLEDSRPYIVFRYVEGEDLGARARALGGRLPVEEVVTTGVDVAGALEAAHAQGVVHRDVKPANLLREASGRVLLCDFGIARPDIGETVRTHPGMILGTPGFLAPEVWSGAEPTPASDQYALAATLWELLLGTSVRRGGDLAEILAEVRAGAGPVAPAELPSGASPLIPVLRRALADDPSRRYPDTASLADALASPGERPTAQPRTTRGATPLPSPRAPSRLASTSTSPSPWLPLAAVALACLAALAATRPAAAPPPLPPGPPPGPDPLLATQAQLEAAYEAIVARHRGADGAPVLDVDPAARADHVAHFEEDILDVRRPPQVARYLRALRAWTAAAREARVSLGASPETRPLLRRYGRDLPLHLAQDLRALEARRRPALMGVRTLEVDTAERARARARREELAAAVDAVRREDGRGPPEEDTAFLWAVHLLLQGSEDHDSRGELAELAARLAGGEPLIAPDALFHDWAGSMIRRLRDGVADCEALRRLLPDVGARARESLGELSQPGRLSLVERALKLTATLRRECEPDRRDVDGVDQWAHLLGGLAEGAPDEVVAIATMVLTELALPSRLGTTAPPLPPGTRRALMTLGARAP
jgi:serine/threonine protein kinase